MRDLVLREAGPQEIGVTLFPPNHRAYVTFTPDCHLLPL